MEKMSPYLTRNRTSSRLRSRNTVKNYKDDSTLIHEKLLPIHENSFVLVEKLRIQKKKLPIYKCISPENPTNNPNEVYEFKFDVNDSNEKLSKKRRRRPVVKRTIVRKKMKNISKKRNVQEQEVQKEESPITIESKETVKESPSEPLENKVSVEPVVENRLEEEPVQNLEKQVEEKKGEPVVQSDIPENKRQEQIKDNTHTKPTIISVQDLSNKNITVVDNSQKSNSEDFKPFRPTNVFSNKLMVQQKNVHDHSLFEKSLSPIMKSSENVNLDSPWRAPQLLAFSQVKNVFQSTPQSKKFNITSKRLTRPVLNESKNYGNITTSRKFGTEITNIGHSLQSNVVEETSKQIVTETENIPPSMQLISDIESSMNSASKFDTTENKENSVLTPQSPKKFHKKGLKNVKALSPRKITNIKIDGYKENLDPQPGPSGLQSNRIFNEQRVLRQSNLNNLLNIMEMPQSTTIKTSHGFFDDGESTPVSRKPVIKLHKPDTDLQHAFGFDDDSNQDVSPIEHDVTKEEQKDEKAIETSVEKRDVKPFARISVNEMRNNLLPRKPLGNVRSKRNIKSKKLEMKKLPVTPKQKVQIDIANFSDTFDVLSEISETPAMSVSDVPMFADLEPSHFTQPPQRLYKRKRAVTFSFQEESDEEEDEERFMHKAKRKDVDKMKVEQEKRLMEWVRDINRTFEEIDEHELVVE